MGKRIHEKEVSIYTHKLNNISKTIDFVTQKNPLKTRDKKKDLCPLNSNFHIFLQFRFLLVFDYHFQIIFVGSYKVIVG